MLNSLKNALQIKEQIYVVLTVVPSSVITWETDSHILYDALQNWLFSDIKH